MKLLLLLLLCVLFAGCASLGPELWVEYKQPGPSVTTTENMDVVRLLRDSSDCEREARAAGSLWMDVSPLWRAIGGIKSTSELYQECMVARGYHPKPEDKS